MTRIPLTLIIALGGALATGCTDLDQTTSSESQALSSECTSGIEFDGKMPVIGQWTGQAPAPISANQYFVVAPIDSQGKQFLAVQVDWEQGRIGWAAKVTKAQRAQVAATLSIQPGTIEALGGTRGPIKFPPGTDEFQSLIDRGFRSSM